MLTIQQNNASAIKMLDLEAQNRALQEEIESALHAVLQSGQYVLGKEVAAFEQEAALYHNVQCALGLASGTDALHLALRALGVEAGDEVITTPFTFIATAEAIAYVGATPVFVDIDPHTLTLDPAKIEEKITQKTKAIIPVHLFGSPCDMDPIMALAQQHNLKVIEDCAQAFGAHYRGTRVGSIGHAGCFSFYPTKNLSGCGDGGMLITNDPEVAERVKCLRNHGAVSPYTHQLIGYNSRLDEIQAAILRIKLPHLDTYNQKRRALAKIYTSQFKGIRCPQESPDSLHVYNQYTIQTTEREALKDILKAHSIPFAVYYPKPLHLQEVFQDLGYARGDFLISEAASEQVLSLPMYPELEPEAVNWISDLIQ